jgi:hypothetical protein
MACRCDSSSIVVGPIDLELRQLAADTIGATKDGNDKSDLGFSDRHIGAEVRDHRRPIPACRRCRRRIRSSRLGSSMLPNLRISVGTVVLVQQGCPP